MAHPSWQDAFREAMTGVAEGSCTAIVGEPGTGKTLLLTTLQCCLDATGVRTVQLRPGNLPADIPGSDVLLIDEADLLNTIEFDRVARLPNPMILTGLPGLPGLLVPFLPGARTLRTVRLERLQPEQVARFVRARLAAASHQHPAFSPEAVLALARHSGGLFRLVSILAGASLFAAEQRNASEVSVSDVDEAAALRASAFDPPERPEPEGAPAAALEDSPLPVHGGALAEIDGWWSERRYAAARWSCLLGACFAVVGVAVLAAAALTGLPPPQLAQSVVPEVALQPATLPLATPSFPVVAAAVPPSPVSARSPYQAPSAQVDPSLPFSPLAVSLTEPPRAERAPAGLLAGAVQAPEPVAKLAFSGPILNTTMGQAGTLSLEILPEKAGGRIGAVFRASHGLIGTGTLNGAVGPDGRLKLTGQLMMGRNPFDCTLKAILEGGHLVGEATFVHQANGAAAHSTFTLSRL